MRATLIILFSLIYVVCCGQDIHKQVAKIKSDPAYKWGEGYGATIESADNMALSALISQISLSIMSKFDNEESQKTVNGDVHYSETVQSQLKTYSIGTFQNVGLIVISDEPDAQVFRYIKNDEIDKIYEERISKVKSYIEFGQKEEGKYQMADALRYYNWALALLQTYPYPEQIKVPDSGKEVSAKLWLDSKINEILNNIRFSITNIDEEDSQFIVNMDITYKGQIVTNLDYSYNDGYRYVGPISAKDGRATAGFNAKPARNIRIKCEYIFANQAKTLDQEVNLALSAFTPRNFSNALIIVPVRNVQTGKTSKSSSKQEDILETNSVQQQIKAIEANQVTFAKADNEAVCRSVMQEIEKAVRSKNHAGVRNFFTPEGYEMFNALIHNGNASIIRSPEYRFMPYRSMTLCRSIPMQFKFKNNRQFIEDVVFRFNKDGKIESLAYALTKKAENDILTSDKKWDNDTRLTLINFLEDYQTAYALKRIDYLESVFSDDALIITGTVLSSRKAGRDVSSALSPDNVIKETRYTKAQYIKKLRESFASKEFINIHLEDNDILSAKNHLQGVYAIQIKQNYFSNNYGDSGYLSLAVDLRDKMPVIKIRVWQSEKNSEFTVHSLLKAIQYE
ncbi:MAG: LPP20 family lipoprotein [Dysgonamonadaceae bacterium]|jgi:hypothetical protein|nr:LPP20 family lipoprotein [Dysgonamonadaceae bacterium]